MSLLLVFAFLFFAGSLIGWCIEVLYRRFVANRKTKKWINPGFLNGPYLPLYGFGLCALYLLAQIDVSFIPVKWLADLVLFIMMAIVMTAIEFVAGLIFIRGMKIKLWDYSTRPGNIGGIICPLFSFFWAVLSAVYYLFIHPYVEQSIAWLSGHLVFSFVIGFFFGVLTIDFCVSIQLTARIRRFAKDNHIVVRYEALKTHIATLSAEHKKKAKFLFAFHTEMPFSGILRRYLKNENKTEQNQK